MMRAWSAWLPHIKAMVVGLIVITIMVGLFLICGAYPAIPLIMITLGSAYAIGSLLIGVLKL